MDDPTIGLVGCGGMGHRHLHAYGALRRVGADGFELAAVCDPRREAAEHAADLVAELLGSRPAVFAERRGADRERRGRRRSTSSPTRRSTT